MGHPAGGVVGLGSLGGLELAIRPFARNKFKKESMAHPAAAGSAPFFRALVVYSYQVYSGEGADNVI
jgi:hypothetical protein